MNRYWLRITIVLGMLLVCGALLRLKQRMQPPWNGSGTDSVISIPPTLHASAFTVDLSHEEPTDGVLTARFGLRNTGECPLVFLSVKASCTCAAAVLSTNTLREGQKVELIVRISSEKSAAGRANVLIGTNDPENPTSVFQVKWDPKSFGFSFEPRVVDFGRVTPHSTEQRLVRICGDVAESFTGSIDVVAVDANKGDVQTILDAKNDALMVTLTSGTFPGVERGALVALASDGTTVGTCPISWEVVPEVQALPNALYLGTAEPGNRLSEFVVLEHISGTAPHVLNFEFVPDVLDASARVSEETCNQTRVKVEVVVPDVPGIIRTTLRARCQVFGGIYELDIPVFLVIRRSL